MKLNRARVWIDHAWSWDLQLALAIGGLTAIGQCTTDIPETWIFYSAATLTVISGTLLITTTNMWNSVQSLTLGSEYGELIRSKDPQEDGIRMPFTIARIAAWASLTTILATSVIVAMVDWSIARFMISVSATIFSWALFACLAVFLHQNEHQRLSAQLQANLEQHRREQRRAQRESAPSHDDPAPK